MWCWWCCHPFEGTPLSMPYQYDDRTNKFKTAGTFCTWSCVKSYTLHEYGVNRGGIICGNIVMMRKIMYKTIGHIPKAPLRQRLKVFGGDLSIEDFRKNLIVETTPCTPVVQEPVKNILIPFVSNIRKMDEIKNATGNNETLKLKRGKPLQREKNNLETALGITFKSKV